MTAKPGTSKSNIVLPKTKSTTIKKNGSDPGSKYGYGVGKKSKAK